MSRFRHMLNLSAMTASTPTFRTTTRLVAGLVLPFALALAGVAAATAGSETTRSGAATDAQANAIVRVRPGHERSVEALVSKLGGTVHTRLKIIGGFSATLPAARLPGAAPERRRPVRDGEPGAAARELVLLRCVRPDHRRLLDGQITSSPAHATGGAPATRARASTWR